MRGLALQSGWRRAAGVALGASALSLTVACNGTPGAAAVAAQSAVPNHAPAPVMVGCEPHQRTLVRQVVVNGAAVSQVDCVATEAAHAQAPSYMPHAPAPVAYAPPAAAYAARQPVYAPAPAAHRPAPVPAVSPELADTEIVPVQRRSARPVRTNQVVYEERPVRQTRSVAKSAIIIGSSAGAGAGVGAAIGGKKGALIGAAIGGGGAAVWDQATRRK